jgi:hypothetical protein
MKFLHLGLGARFEFEGKTYTKTGPMTASADAGGQRMIPRYADLIPLDGAPPPPARKTPASLDAALVRAAFERFYEDAQARVDTSQRLAMAEARGRFLAALGLDGR